MANSSISDQPALVVVWRITTRCGLACGFCAFDRTLARTRRTTDIHQINTFGRVLSQYSQRSGRAVHVSWLGGEPLQFPQIADVSRRFHWEYGLSLGVTTNGVALANSEIRGLLLECFDQVTISVDGLAPFHNNIRRSPNLMSQLQRDVARLKANSSGELLLRVNTVLMRDNIEQFPEFAKEMAAWGFEELTFNPLGGNDRPEFFIDHCLEPAQVSAFRKMLPELRQRMAVRGLRIVGTEAYLDRIEATVSGRKISREDCAPGTQFLFIDEIGRIAPCSFTAESYGQPIERYNGGEALQSIRNDFQRVRQDNRQTSCDDCLATHTCGKFVDLIDPSKDSPNLVREG